ncbi:MAG: DUF5678 domain-containing protein [Nanoarchaeota archaeon]
MEKINKEFWEDLLWGEEHHTEFLKQYKDRWVAIRNKKVVAFGKNLAGVRREAQQKTGNEQIPVVFVECGEHIYGQS